MYYEHQLVDWEGIDFNNYIDTEEGGMFAYLFLLENDEHDNCIVDSTLQFTADCSVSPDTPTYVRSAIFLGSYNRSMRTQDAADGYYEVTYDDLTDEGKGLYDLLAKQGTVVLATLLDT